MDDGNFLFYLIFFSLRCLSGTQTVAQLLLKLFNVLNFTESWYWLRHQRRKKRRKYFFFYMKNCTSSVRKIRGLKFVFHPLSAIIEGVGISYEGDERTMDSSPDVRLFH